MTKNILAIAIAAAVMAPSAFAAATVYGNAHMSVDSVSNGDKSVMAVGSNSSYVGVKGSEDLAGGMKAVYQMEFQIAMDGDNGASGVSSASKGVDGGLRNAFAGIGGGFGTVLLGKHDTPLKMVGRKFDQFGDRIGDLRNFTSADTTGTTTYGWDMRPSNVVAYVSPAFGGFTGILAYVAAESVDANGTLKNTTNGSNADAAKTDAYSVSLTGAVGKLDLAVAYENHANSFSGTIDKAMTAYRLGAGYDFGMVKVTGLYANQDVISGTDIKARSIYALGAGVKVGAAGTVKAQYAMVDKLSGVADSGATMYTVGYDHAMSKNTTAYVAYSLTDNQSAAKFNTAGGGHGESMSVAQDANLAYKDPSAISVGIQHKF